MAIIPVFTPLTTSNSGLFSVGFKWSSDSIKNITGGSIFFTDQGAPPSSVVVTLYDLNTEAVLVTNTVSTVGFTVGQWNDVLFSSPYTISIGVNYVIALEFDGDYSYNNDTFDLPVVQDGITIPAGGGHYSVGGGFPSTTWNGCHGAAMVYLLEASASLSGSLPFVTGSFSGEASASGQVSGSIPSIIGSIDALSSSTASLEGSLPELIGSFSAIQITIKTFAIDYGTREVVYRDEFSLVFSERSMVEDTFSLVFDSRMITYPSRIFSVLYHLRKTVSRSSSLLFGVRVPIAADKTFSIDYDVRLLVIGSPQTVQYDTLVVGPETISKSTSILYHTLVSSTEGKMIVTPIRADGVPPQIVTTSF